MKNQSFIIFFILASVMTLFGQQRTLQSDEKPTANRCSKPILETGKPAVYLTFIRKKTIKPTDPSDDSNYLFFKLTNNSCWPILLDMSGVADDRYGDASLYYLIESKKVGERLTGSLYCHVCSFNGLGSGKYIVFSIPLREADRGSRMRIRYKYEWENEQNIGDYENSNTTNTVAYNFDGLSEAVLPKSTSPSDSGFRRP